MLYSEYKEKLNRRTAIFVKLWKFRWLFFAFFIVLIAAFVLMGLVGTVYVDKFDSEIVYGESLSPSSKAIFGSVTYEYKVDGEWTTTEPILCGQYEFRAVSHGLAGMKKCGNSHSYSILQADAHVNLLKTPVTYGENPRYEIDLKYGDVGTATKFVSERTGNGVLSYFVDTESVKIVNEQGEDVTFCYNVIADHRDILTQPRTIKITTGSASWTYDGQPHSCVEYGITEGELLAGHKLTVSFAAVTDAGTIPNTPNGFMITDIDGEDVTDFYEIKTTSGTLEILPKRLLLKTNDESFVYDGQPHSCGKFEVAEGLLEGHILINGEPSGALPTLTDVGFLENAFSVSFTVMNGDKDVTGNYAAELTYGTLTVTKRQATIKTGSKTFVYDGQPHACLDFELKTELVSGHSAVPTSKGHINVTDGKEAGFIDNVLDFSIVDGDDDVTDNYEIKFEWGKVRIKSPVTVRINAISKHYDGTPLAFEGDEFKIEALPIDVSAEQVKVKLVGSLTEVGSIDAKTLRAASEVWLNDAEGENRVDFVCDTDPLIVLKRILEVSSISICEKKGSSPIDGNVRGAAWISFGSLVSGHELKVIVSGKLELNKNSSKNTISSVTIMCGDRNVTSNYDIRLKEGTLAWL